MTYFKGSKEIDVECITKETGVPSGRSSGKVQSTIAYAKGMGLLQSNNNREYCLTKLGTCILGEDPFLVEPLTQWILHLQLCNRFFGADLWYTMFTRGRKELGNEFSKEKIDNYLRLVYGIKGRSLIGPLLRTYIDDASLSLIDPIINKTDIIYEFRSVPLFDYFQYFFAYSLLSIWEASSFKNDKQTTIEAFNNETGFFDMYHLNVNQIEEFLSLLVKTECIDVDKQITPWVLSRKKVTNEFVDRIYCLY